MSEAKSFSRNPLGIIALFISLIYGFACLVFGLGSKSLTCVSEMILVIFLVLFPIFILVSFIYLVVNHHQKLYAPMDYRSDKTFIEATIFETLPEKRQVERMEIDVEQSEKSLDLEGDNGRKTDPLETENPQAISSNTKKDYFLLEELAIRKLELEFNTTISRQVSFGTSDESIVEADGIFVKNETYNIVEVKYTKGKKITITMLQHIESIIEKVAEEKGVKVKLIFVIIHRARYGPDISKQLQGQFELYKDVTFKHFNEDKLKEFYNV